MFKPIALLSTFALGFCVGVAFVLALNGAIIPSLIVLLAGLANIPFLMLHYRKFANHPRNAKTA